MIPKRRKKELDIEQTLSDDWSRDKDSELMEVPLGNGPMVLAGFAVTLIAAALIARVAFVGIAQSARYSPRSDANQNIVTMLRAQRGAIYDRNGNALADNRPVFSAYLKVDEFLRNPDLQEKTLAAAGEILEMRPADVLNLIRSSDLDNNRGILDISPDLGHEDLVKLKSLDLPAIEIEDNFRRNYPDGEIFSSVLGYVGRVAASDLEKNLGLLPQDIIGKSGIELLYDKTLLGVNGKKMQKRNAHGELIGEEEEIMPSIGKSVYLTIDADFQKYFYQRMKQGLSSLGRTRGVGLAMDPRNGEVLAMINFPVFDNNILSNAGNDSMKQAILNSRDHPLFSRAVSGLYTPGSTIKPLVAAAALKEEVIAPLKEIFSPGYLDIPNPYNPDLPTRYVDWRYQGYVNTASAIAQSSNVYFYEVGGGGPDSAGLGINRLRQWWEKFNLGSRTGVDLPGEAKGLLPSPEWKEKRDNRPWLLGDTYNVSIGQGDLLLTPIQLLNYICSMANGGRIYRPSVNKDSGHEIISDISYLSPQFQEVRKGMRMAVTSGLGTANMLNDLGFAVEGKTGSAQVQNNQQENAFFVGYTVPDSPSENQVAVLILVENSREGSLNAVPIAKDVLDWYYWNRIKRK